MSDTHLAKDAQYWYEYAVEAESQITALRARVAELEAMLEKHGVVGGAAVVSREKLAVLRAVAEAAEMARDCKNIGCLVCQEILDARLTAAKEAGAL